MKAKMKQVRFLFLSLGLLAIPCFTQKAEAAECRASEAVGTGPYGEPFINGMNGDDNIGSWTSCSLNRVKANGLRFWITLYNFTDRKWLDWPDGPVQKLRREIPFWRALGYKITLTVSLQMRNYMFFENYDEPKGFHNQMPSPRRVETTMRKVVKAFTLPNGKSMIDNYQLFNEVGLYGKEGYWPERNNIQTPLNYVENFYIPMATAVKDLTNADIYPANIWCGGFPAARIIRQQLLPDLLKAVLKNPRLKPKGFDCHQYDPDEVTNLLSIQEFRTDVDNLFMKPLRKKLDKKYRYKLILSEWNCKAEQNPWAAEKCLLNIFKNPNRTNPNNLSLLKLADEAYYFTFYPYPNPKYNANHLEQNLEKVYLKGVDGQP